MDAELYDMPGEEPYAGRLVCDDGENIAVAYPKSDDPRNDNTISTRPSQTKYDQGVRLRQEVCKSPNTCKLDNSINPGVN